MQDSLASHGAECRREHERLGATIKIKCRNIRRGRALDGSFFVRRKFCLQLIRDRFGDFALNCEHVIDWPIVILRPLMRIGAHVDQLRVDPHFVCRALYAAFEQMRHAELLTNLAQVALNAALVLHH